jgi:hypothetical protein
MSPFTSEITPSLAFINMAGGALIIINSEFVYMDFRITNSLFKLGSNVLMNFTNVNFEDFSVTSIVSNYNSMSWASTYILFLGIKISVSNSKYNLLPPILLQINSIIIPPVVIEYSLIYNLMSQNVSLIQTSYPYLLEIQNTQFTNITLPTSGQASFLNLENSSLSNCVFEKISIPKSTTFI